MLVVEILVLQVDVVELGVDVEGGVGEEEAVDDVDVVLLVGRYLRGESARAAGGCGCRGCGSRCGC